MGRFRSWGSHSLAPGAGARDSLAELEKGGLTPSSVGSRHGSQSD